MSKLGTYKNKNVYDYNSLSAAINASVDNDIFSVYWITESWGKMFWKGQQIAEFRNEGDRFRVVDFDEELWKPKKKEAPVPPPCVKEVSMKEEEKGPLYDNDWYKKIMNELDKRWSELTESQKL